MKDAVAGLDGGFSGNGREAAYPTDCLFDPVEGFARRGCGCVYEWFPSFLESPGGVGGRSPGSSYENEFFPWAIVSIRVAVLSNIWGKVRTISRRKLIAFTMW